MRIAFVLFASACTPAIIAEADAAITISGSSPDTVQRETLPSVTDWEIATAPSWGACAFAQNMGAGGTGTLLIGRHDETGAVSAANDEYITVQYLGWHCWDLTDGTNTADANHRRIPLASTTASLVVELRVSANKHGCCP